MFLVLVNEFKKDVVDTPSNKSPEVQKFTVDSVEGRL